MKGSYEPPVCSKLEACGSQLERRQGIGRLQPFARGYAHEM
jgi:hypothetical protein